MTGIATVGRGPRAAAIFAGVILLALLWLRDDAGLREIARPVEPVAALPARSSPSAPIPALLPVASEASTPPAIEADLRVRDDAEPIPLDADLAREVRAITAVSARSQYNSGQDSADPIPLEGSTYAAASRPPAMTNRQPGPGQADTGPIPLAETPAETAQRGAGAAASSPVSWQTDGDWPETAIPLE